MFCSFCYACLIFGFILVGSVMVLWWDLRFVVIGFVMVWCVVESINQTHQTSVIRHLICKCSLPSDFGSLPFDLPFGFNHLYLLFGYKNKENFFTSLTQHMRRIFLGSLWYCPAILTLLQKKQMEETIKFYMIRTMCMWLDFL